MLTDSKIVKDLTDLVVPSAALIFLIVMYYVRSILIKIESASEIPNIKNMHQEAIASINKVSESMKALTNSMTKLTTSYEIQIPSMEKRLELMELEIKKINDKI